MLVMMLVMVFPVLGIVLFFVLPWETALPLYLVGVLLSVLLHRVMITSMRQRVRTGRRGLVGRAAEVLSWSGDRGWVRCHAETWQAWTRRPRDIQPGDLVAVVAFGGLTLEVEPRRLTTEEP